MTNTKQQFSSAAGDKGGDFVDAIGEAAKKERVYEEIPPLFPTQAMPADKPIDHMGKEDAQTLIIPTNYDARYQRFDMADDQHREELEEINNHILRDGWLMAREEWNHTKEGSTYSIIKYLVAKNKPK